MQEFPHRLLLVALPPGQLLEGRAGQVSQKTRVCRDGQIWRGGGPPISPIVTVTR